MKKLLCFFLFVGSFLFSETTPPFVLITIPKSGSHLMIKTLYFLTGSEAIWHTKFPSYQYVPSNMGFLYTHFCVPDHLERDYKELPQLKKIIMVRDLRDVAISIIGQIKKGAWPGLTFEKRQEFLKMDFEDQLSYVINFEYDNSYKVHRLQVSLSKLGQQAAIYAKDPHVLTCRYEDLVGPSGGGTIEAQIESLQKIAEFLSLDLSDEQIYDISMRIYGDQDDPFGSGGFRNFQSTFRTGKIGLWRSLFSDQHKEEFKKKHGQSLIDLGYEIDYEW